MTGTAADMGRFWVKWQTARAARRYERHLRPQLCRDYGFSETYTAKQIEASAARAKLPVDYLAFGYASAMSEESFSAANLSASRDLPGTYGELRAMLLRYARRSPPSSRFEPMSASDYTFAAIPGDSSPDGH